MKDRRRVSYLLVAIAGAAASFALPIWICSMPVWTFVAIQCLGPEPLADRWLPLISTATLISFWGIMFLALVAVAKKWKML